MKNAQQYRTDTGAVIPDPSGVIPAGVGVCFDCAPTDTTGATIQMQVELQKLPATWTGSPNYSSSFVASGSRPRTSSATGLAAGNYGWRYRVVNNAGVVGNWVAASNPDFIVQAASTSVSTIPAVTLPVTTQPVYTPPPATSVTLPVTTLPVYTATTTAVAPSIISVSPASMPPLNGNQLLTISGYNFQSGATLSFVPPEGGTINSLATKLTFVSANQINYQINNLSDAGTWTVRVNNPGGQSSSPVSFTVAASAQSSSSPVVASPVYPSVAAVVPTISSVLPPAITGIVPASLPPLNSNQPMTITGNNFQNGATLTFVPPEGGSINSFAAKLTFVSANQINYQINNLSDLGNWTVRVNNPGGQSSSPVGFTVSSAAQTEPSLAAPSIPASPTPGTPTFSLLNPSILTLPNGAANTQMAGSTPMTNSFVLPPWLKASNIPQALSSILADVSKSQNLPLKLETYTDTKFGGLAVGEYRITPNASVDLNGVAGTLKVLQKVDDAATLYSIYDYTKSEFESRGITGHSLINAWVSSPQSIVFAFQNPDAGIQALVDGFTSASAVSIRFASFGLIEVHGPQVEQWVNKMANVNSGLQTLPTSKTGSAQPIAPSPYSPPPQVRNVPTINNPQFPAGSSINPRSPMMPGVDLTPHPSK